MFKVCIPRDSYKRFRWRPYWLNSIGWESGDSKIYRWLWFNWSMKSQYNAIGVWSIGDTFYMPTLFKKDYVIFGQGETTKNLDQAIYEAKNKAKELDMPYDRNAYKKYVKRRSIKLGDCND